MRRLATYSLKGGVGKTTTAVNLASVSAASGVRTLLWDLDPQGAATHLVRVRSKLRGGVERLVGSPALHDHIRGTDQIGLDVVPADLSLRALDLELDRGAHPVRRLGRLLDSVDEHYDLCILDAAAGLTLASDATVAAADVVLVPTIPAALSIRSLHQLLAIVADELADRGPAVLPFVSMIDRRKRLHREAADQLAAAVPALLSSRIPSSVAVERMASTRVPVVVAAPSSPVATAYRALWDEVAARLWPPPVPAPPVA